MVFTANAQDPPGDWRALLLSKASPIGPDPGPSGADHTAIGSSISGIRELVAGEGTPAHAKVLADSLITELHASDAALHLREKHPSQAVIAYRAAVESAQKIPDYPKRTYELVGALARAQKYANDEEAAIRTYDEAIKRARSAQDTEGERDLLLQKAILCSESGRHQDAIAINTRLLEMAEASNNDQDRVTALLRLSRAYKKVNNSEAFTHARNAYALAEKSDNGRDMLKACELLIESWTTTSENEQCRRLLEKGLAKANIRRIPVEITRFQDLFGRYHVREGQFGTAMEHYKAGLIAIGAKVPSEQPVSGNVAANELLAELLLDMGVCFAAMKDTMNAMLHLEECERIVKSNPGFRVSPWADLGELHLRMGHVAKAAAYGNLALNDADLRQEAGMDDNGLLGRASFLLYQVYKRRGDAVDALEMHERYMAAVISDEKKKFSLDLQRTQLSSAYQDSIIDVKLELQMKEVNRANEKRENATRMRFLIYGGIALFLAGAVVALFDRKRRMARFDREAAQLETQALRSQMNPHFIFNALNSINAFVQKNEPDKAASFLSRFARLMRLVLENSRQAEVPLKDDLEALDAYLHLERTRTGEKFDYRIQVAADIDPEDVMVPPLVAQPFVENAIWHGMSGKEEKGMITLSVSRKGDQLLFAIEDDGVGRSSPKRMASMGESDPASAPAKKTSLGTAITKARLDLVRQQKGKAAGFIYVDLPQGTRVELTLPFSTAA